MTAPAGVAGSLVSATHAAAMLRAPSSPSDRRAAGDLIRWWRRVRARCGPATGVRALADVAAAPLATILGYTLRRATSLTETTWIAVLDAGDVVAPLVVTTWGGSVDSAWRVAVRHSLALHARWCLLFNGTHLRVLDAGRTFARRHLDFELDAAIEADAVRLVLMLASAESLRRSPETGGVPRLDAIVAASDASGLRVCGALRGGVHRAIEHLIAAFVERRQHRSTTPLDVLYEQALTAVYRILFLCFAEARGLVPTWHPVYRDGYTVESMRAVAECADAPDDLWEAFQAISRLAHHGCEAGDLRVTPFNGRLFAPARAPLLERRGLSGRKVRDVVLALSTTLSPDGTRERVTYADLGVEELGAVYEGLLDYEPTLEAGVRLGTERAGGAPAIVLARSDASRRKATGTFYTPRPITRFLVRQALEPLVADASAERILALRIVDPAMGSGAFLVEACRFLARAYEAALVRDGHLGETDASSADRAAFRRLIAQRCLFGVDLNPMAVHLARLSLWLATLAADKPLSFLDHHLLTGDSLLGAASSDIARQVPGRARTRRSDDDQLPLFDPDLLREAAANVQLIRRDLEHTRDETAAIVRRKEQQLTELATEGALRSWKRVADLWCAAWFAPVAPSPGVYRTLVDEVLTPRGVLGPETLTRCFSEMEQLAGAHRFFHWPLEFPEVFFGPDGRELPDGGFDAVVGNPPWEMLRADARPKGDHAAGCRSAMLRFTRDSGVYHAQSDGHANQYQLFVERALWLARPAGRVALVLPAGLVHDHGCAALRRMLVGRCRVESIVGFDNRAGIFPIHRSVRFVLLSAARGGQTARVRCRFGLRDPAVLDRLDETGDDDAPTWLSFTPALLDRLTGPGLAIPYVRSSMDLAILEKIVRQHPSLASPHGWQARFARELNATDDRRHFTSAGRGLPIVEGKHLSPFSVDVRAASLRIAAPVAARLLDRARTFGRARLAFRDVASATNRMTLIAAIVPAGSVTTHTVFCLRSHLHASDQLVLCAILNSYIANFLVRLRVTTHVTLAVMNWLPVPRPPTGSALHAELLRCARALTDKPADPDASAVLHAAAASAYGLTEQDLVHVLASFPLVPRDGRAAVLERFRARLRDGTVS